MEIRSYQSKDVDDVWALLKDTFRTGTTYAVDSNISRENALAMWIDAPAATYVVEVDGVILATYYIKTNQQGGGAHVCNCGYITSTNARGQGLASAMCVHSQDAARDLGYRAMQFNFVLETNSGAIRLWERAGYETIGRIPDAFLHPTAGYVDARIMYKSLL